VVSQIIDLRRFVRAGDSCAFVRADDAELPGVFSHVSTRWATVEVARGALVVADRIRSALYRDGCRLAATFQVQAVSSGDTADVVEVAVASAAVLGERARRTTANSRTATAVHVRSGAGIVKLEARIANVSDGGLAFTAEDRFAPGDELTLVGDEPAFRVRVRVVRRRVAEGGVALFGCRVIAATIEDEKRLRALAVNA
jgi:hypothetical protein